MMFFIECKNSILHEFMWGRNKYSLEELRHEELSTLTAHTRWMLAIHLHISVFLPRYGSKSCK